MSRYLGPRLRIVRRLGYLIGLTRKKPSTKLLNPDARRGIRKVIPPGQHGRSKSFKKKPYESNEYDFLIRLKLKQRIRYHYGITEKQLVNYVRQARKIKGSTGRVLLRLLEMRLDNTVFRLHMAPTIRAARQLINHGHIYVNNKKISIPSYSCKPKDIITPSPKKRSIQLLNNYLTELDQEKSRFKNLLKILKFGKRGLLTNTKTLQNNKEKSNQKNCKPNTIISVRIQRAGTFEGQGIGFLGKNLVIVQPLFGNIKNYLGKSINICIYLKRNNIFYGYPTKPFNIKMRYSKLINSIDAIQYFGRKKSLQNPQNKEIKLNEKDIKTLNKSSSAIILLGGANIFRNKLSKKNQNVKQNYSDNILVRIEAASFGKNNKYILNRKRQLSPFLLNKTRDTNPILFREKYLYSRKNRRFVGINHIFYVKTMLKAVEQNPTTNFSSLYQKSTLENKKLNLINTDNSLFYSKLNKINQNNPKSLEKSINNEDKNVSRLVLKNNSALLNSIVSENTLKLRKHYLAKIKKQNKSLDRKLFLLYLCLKKEKFQSNFTKGKVQTLNNTLFYIKQKILKSLLSQTTIEKNLNSSSFWKVLYVFSKISLKQDSSLSLFSKNSFKNNLLQTFSKMILDKQKNLHNKNISIKSFLFFSKIFSFIQEWKNKALINDAIFETFVKNIKESLSFIILLQQSMLSLLKLKNNKEYSSFNIQSNSILEYYRHQEYQILKSFQIKIQSEIAIKKFDKLSNPALLLQFTNKNQFRKVLEINNIKQEFNLYLTILSNKKIFNSNLSYNIDIFNYSASFLNNHKFRNTFVIFRNYLQNKKNVMKKQFFKDRFELKIFTNLVKKTTLFSNSSLDDSYNSLLETGKKINVAFLRKQILQKFNIIKIQFDFKKGLLTNLVNQWNSLNYISSHQNEIILSKIQYNLSQDKQNKYENLFFHLIEISNGTLVNNDNFFNKIKNSIVMEKTFQRLLSYKLESLQNLEEVQSLGLILNLNKNKLINLINKRIDYLFKLTKFERYFIINKTIATDLKKKITNENIVDINNNIYTMKINSFAELSSNSNSINDKKIIEKLEQQIILQKIKQKNKFLSICQKYENSFIKDLNIFNIDQNGKYLTNFLSELVDLDEKKFFKKLDQTSMAFYPIELNRKIIKEKIIQTSTSWLNYIVIFNKIDQLYKENEITNNKYSILISQAKAFVIKQLILNKNKFFIGYNNYLKLGQNNINCFINKIQNNSIDHDLSFFQFSFIQINQKYSLFINFLTKKQKLFSNQSIKNLSYINKLMKYNLFNNVDISLNNSLKQFSKEEMESQLNLNIEKNNFEEVYNRIFIDNNFKSTNFSNRLSSNIILKLSMNTAKWVDNFSIIKVKKGLNLLRKQKLITKPNYKLFMSFILKFKQDTKKLTNNIFESPLLFKTQQIYQQKRIQSFINLLLNLNLCINYIKLNTEVKSPINRNVQNEVNKKFYYQYNNQIVSNQKINHKICNFVIQFKNKLQILNCFKIINSSETIQFNKFIEQIKNEIIQLNLFNNSINKTPYKTTNFLHKIIKFCNLFTYYHLKSSKKRNKNSLLTLTNQTQKDSNENNYLRDDLLTKLYAKFSLLKQQNLLTISKYEKFIAKLKEQPLTKKLIFNLMNEINFLKFEQLIELKYIHSDLVFYSNVLFYKFITSFNIIKEHYEIKENQRKEQSGIIYKIKIQLNQNFQNQFEYILYLSKFNSFIQNDILTNQQKNQIEKQLINIINNMKNYSKRSIKLQERLKYGFINYRKYETITQNLLKNLQFKVQNIIYQKDLINNQSLLARNVYSLSDKNKEWIEAAFSIFNFKNFKHLKLNNSIKNAEMFKEVGLDKLEKLMSFGLTEYQTKSLDQENFEWDVFVLNYFKKEFQFSRVLKICQQIEKNSSYLKEIKNQTKTKIISQTRKIFGNLTLNQTQTKISKIDEKLKNKETKSKKNILKTLKISLIKQFVVQMKNIIYSNFTQNSSIKIKNSQERLILLDSIFNDLTNIKTNQNTEELIDLEDYFKKLEFNLHFTTLNNFYFKKHALKISNPSKNFNNNLSQSKLLASHNLPQFKLLNLKIEMISKLLQKSYKSKIVVDINNKKNKLFNISRIQKLKSSGLYSLKNKKSQKNQQIQERYNKLENLLINSNYSNPSLILQYLQFEVNLLKKSQYCQQFNNYLTNYLSFISNKLNNFKNKSRISTIYKQIKNLILKTLLLNILISPNLENLKFLINNDFISTKLSKKIKTFYYRKKYIVRLQNVLSKLKQNSFNDIYPLKEIYPKIIVILEQFNNLKMFNLISQNQYNFLQTQILQILKYEQYISRLNKMRIEGILTNTQYNQILLKIQQKIVQKVREQKIVQKFKQYIQYLYQTKNNDEIVKNENTQQRVLNYQYKKIISLNQGKWAIVAIKEFYKQNLLTTMQYNEIMEKIEKNIRNKVQIAKLFSTNRNLSQLKLSAKFKSGMTRKQNKKNFKVLKSLPNSWTKNILKELRKQSNISNQTYIEMEKHLFDKYYFKTKRRKISDFLNEASKEEFTKTNNTNRSQIELKENFQVLKKSIEALLNYKKQIMNWLSMVENTSIHSDSLFDLSYLTSLKNNENISQKEYNKLKIYNKLAMTRLAKLKIIQKSEAFNNMQYEKIYQKIIKSYLIIQYKYIQHLLRNKQSFLHEIYNKNNKSINKKINKNLSKIKISKKLIKTSNSLFSLIQEILSQLPISTTNKNQSSYRQRIIYNRLYAKLRSDDVLIKKWKEILTRILKKQLTPPLDIPPHLELRRIQISIIPTNVTKKSKKNLIIPVGTVMSLPSRKTVGVSVLERLIVEYYSRN